MMKQDSRVLITVVVCTYNRARLLPTCLDALVDQTFDKNLYEVIIVDNNSTDNTRAVAEQYVKSQPNFRYEFEGRQGHAYARNKGWQSATGEYIAYLDDDTKAVPEWCLKIAEAFSTVIPKPAAVGGKILPWFEKAPPKWFIEEFETRTWGEAAGYLEPPRAKCGFSGANMAIPRDLLDDVGGFSTDFGIVGGRLRMGEDTDLFYRIYQKAPWFWYDPEIKVFHWTPAHVTKIGYRFRRAMVSGKSLAYLDQSKCFSIKYAKDWLSLGLFFFKGPFKLLRRKKPFVAQLVFLLEELGSRIGYLFGSACF